jgi:hypothetical protein
MLKFKIVKFNVQPNYNLNIYKLFVVKSGDNISGAFAGSEDDKVVFPSVQNTTLGEGQLNI